MIRLFDKVIDQIVAVIQNLFMSSLNEKTPGVSIHFFSLTTSCKRSSCAPQCIILTGGLGLNRHVQKTVKLRLEQWLGSDHHPKFIMGGPHM